ncbi:MAG TPA: GNAT family N-acetyltransferase [Archangium sp.]|uniref:GNAT family N-acetyltransferase n=1 Tax=Archangium sp. TaxID=1872627 RepID=UPI002E36F793|nr:GNAT family N-acetyltransferase [Archangium sp.]HEX5750417.1 GNAT family N-acetyltransferase [Archangium sp.]
MAPYELQRVPASETRYLRHVVLRPHQRPEELIYPGDDAPDTVHFALYVGGQQHGVASLYREPRPGTKSTTEWRLRGMAVLASNQGRGYGAALLQACIDHAARQGGTRLWCNARTTASGFYKRLGFNVEGAEFELPGIGPHYLMWRPL